MIILVVVLAVLLAGALVGCFYFWKRGKQEENKKWDEISRGVDLENIIADRTKDVIHYSDLCDEQRQYILHLQTRNIDLQDKYSALICPTNNHVWKNGVCKKCGRAYNG